MDKDFKSFLTAQYPPGTPVQVVYELAASVTYAHPIQPETLPAYYGTEDFVTALAGEDVTGKWLSFTNDGTQLNFKGGGGLGSSKLAAADALAANVLSGKKFYAGNKIIKTGTMPERGTWNATYAGTDITIPDGHHSGTGKFTVDGGNQGAKTAALNAGGSYTIPQGWHNGSGKVIANPLSGQTSGTAAADDIRTGKTAWVNGAKITGSLPVYHVGEATYINLWTRSSDGKKFIQSNHIPEGIYESNGEAYSPQVNAPAELFGNAAAAQVLAGVTFTSLNGAKIAGTMPNQGAKTAALNAGGSYTIPQGWHNGSGKVTANSLASQTDANAAAGNILTGKTAWVKGSKITGTMANRGAPNQTLGIGGSYSLSAGYYSGGKISAKGSFSGSGSSGDKSGSYAEIYRNESNVTREIQARSHASASISGKTVTITVHAEAYQRANDIPSLSGTKSSVDYSFSFNID